MNSVLCLTCCLLAGLPLGPGTHRRTLVVDELRRSYLIHVPPQYCPEQPAAVVLILHGAGTNAAFTVPFTGMNRKADEAGFVAVYPNGTGVGPLRSFNAGGVNTENPDQVDDVLFISELLDDLDKIVNVDPRRVFATGMSNGGMMCYRLAAELPERIAAIAPVAGTMAIEQASPSRPVPVMHFHGTEDWIVPYDGPNEGIPDFLTFKSVDETIAAWVEINGCPPIPVIDEFPDQFDDGTTVTRFTYGPGTGGSEVVLMRIAGGGHTWPGRPSPFPFLGNSTREISANDLIWEFFLKHPLP